MSEADGEMEGGLKLLIWVIWMDRWPDRLYKELGLSPMETFSSSSPSSHPHLTLAQYKLTLYTYYYPSTATMKFATALVTLLSAALISAAPAPEVAELDARATSPCPPGKVGLCCNQWTSSQEAVAVCASPSTAPNQDVFRNQCQGRSTPTSEWRAYCCNAPAGLTVSSC